MRKQIIPLLFALSVCLLALPIELIPIWNHHSIAASQDKPTAAEVAAAIEEQKQEAANMARSALAEQKFQELTAKANLDGTVAVIVQLRVAFRPEGDLLNAAKVQAQRDVIHQTQDLLMKELTGYDPASLKRFEYTPYVAVKVNAAGLESLRLSPDVIDIHNDNLLAPTLAESVPLTRASFAWADGYTGAGKTVAILDTGVYKIHPFLSGRVVSEACYSTNNTDQHATSLCPGGVTESTAVDSGLSCAISGCSHGTLVAGVAAGKGSNFSGVAKEANLISIQVFSKIDDSSECDGNSPCIRSFTSDILKALERVYSLRDTHSIASVNLSLGSGRFTSNCDTHPLKGIIDQLRSAGIATVISSGNDGYTDAISEPACISSAISVGATGDGSRYGPNQVAPYSNSASFLTMLAPGDNITSSLPSSAEIFDTSSGTSMAAPHVAGGWAILKQRTPTASVTELLNLLTSRGFPVTDTRNGLTFPRLNLGPPPACVVTLVPSNHWKGEYFGNTDLTGAPMMIRDDGPGPLSFDIGDGSPGAACGLGADNFSARWTQKVNLETAAYRFTVTGDDGVRLYIDGQLKIDKWFLQGPTTYTVDVFLRTGEHEIRLEYFEGGGGAVAQVSWETLVGVTCYTDFIPPDHWRGEYFGNTTLKDNPLMTRDEGTGFLNFDFGDGSPNSTCGLGADNFSARWSRWVNFTAGPYRFTVTGDDGVRLYIDGQLKIDKWFLHGPTTYTANVLLTTGLHEVRLEYFEGSGGAVAKLSWETLAGSECFADVPSDHWKGTYYNFFTSGPQMVRDDGDGFLNFDFGDGSPSAACGVGADQFQVYWTRMVNFAPGYYRFTVTADDGVHLWVNGNLVIDKFIIQAPTTYTADVYLPGGAIQVDLDYFEQTGGAVAKLSWAPLPSDCFAPVPSGHWKGEYFSNTDLAGPTAMIRDDGDGFLNFDFGGGGPSPTCGPGADNFSVRWSRTVHFETAGAYRFTVTADDGVRLYIGGVGGLVLNKWFVQAPTTYTAIVFVAALDYPITLEYFEREGGAVAQLSWEPLDNNCYAPVFSDHWQGEYYDNTDLAGSPVMIRDDGGGFLNIDFGSGSPSATCGPGADNFSARWTRWFNFAPGTYRFTVTGDDGVRLSVGGQLLVDKWLVQAPTTYTADIKTDGGLFPIVLEYFEKEGGAVARLNWTLISGP